MGESQMTPNRRLDFLSKQKRERHLTNTDIDLGVHLRSIVFVAWTTASN